MTTSPTPRPSRGARRTNRAPSSGPRSTAARSSSSTCTSRTCRRRCCSDSSAKIDFAVVEATEVTADGRVFLTTSVGLSPTLLHSAKKIIIELNRRHSSRLREMTDIALLPPPPHRLPIPILDPLAKIGVPYVQVDRARSSASSSTPPPTRSALCPAGSPEPAHRRPGRATSCAGAARRSDSAGVPAAAGGRRQRLERGHGAARERTRTSRTSSCSPKCSRTRSWT